MIMNLQVPSCLFPLFKENQLQNEQKFLYHPLVAKSLLVIMMMHSVPLQITAVFLQI